MSQDVWHTPWWVNGSYTNWSVTRDIAWKTWDFPGKKASTGSERNPALSSGSWFLVGLDATRKKSTIFGLVQCMVEKRKHLSVSFGKHFIKKDPSSTAKASGGKGPRAKFGFGAHLIPGNISVLFSLSFNARFCLFLKTPTLKQNPKTSALLTFVCMLLKNVNLSFWKIAQVEWVIQICVNI